jgi:mannose-6-phosphate isomerase-like protein (cupin superfamily)
MGKKSKLFGFQNTTMIEKITNKNQLLSIIIRKDYQTQGIEFFTNDDDSQQLGYMNRPKDYIIPPHRHNLVKRAVHLTQEVLFIKSGKVRVDFFDNEQHYIKSTILNPGDVILLSDGGHGFKMLEQSEIIEVKQGPYCGEEDKVRFEPLNDNDVIF